ncbi:TBC domain protein [Ostertagia ostertagi]
MQSHVTQTWTNYQQIMRRELILGHSLLVLAKDDSSPPSPSFVRGFSPMVRHASLRMKERLRTRLSEPLRERLNRSMTRLHPMCKDHLEKAYVDDETSSSGEDDDPELRELEERDNIVMKYEKGPESKDIDPWENPEFDVYAKMDRFGFVHKDPNEATEEERSNRRRIAKEAWKKGRLPKKLEERTWKGIPEKLRLKVWPRLLGAYELKETRPNLYQELLKRALLVSRDIKQIDLDINRTYRDHLAFRRRYDVKQQSLLNVLAAYAMYNTEEKNDIPYIYLTKWWFGCFLDRVPFSLALRLLRYFSCTWTKKTLFGVYMLLWSAENIPCMFIFRLGFFVPGFPKLSRFETHFKKILKKYKPRVYKHLEKNDIPYIYLTKWWFGCFLDRVPFSLALRLWDVYILEGDPVLLAMALNIMKMHEKSIRKLQMENFMDFIQNTLASNFGYSDDETMFSLREVLSKLKSDGLHILPPPRPDDLPEVPTKALGPILSRPISSIREEQEEIKSRRSHAASVGRSPHPRRSKKPIHLRTPSAPGSRRLTSDDACSSSAVEAGESPACCKWQGRSFRNPIKAYAISKSPAYTTTGSPAEYSNWISTQPFSWQLKQPAPQLRTSMMRDEHTGKMVTVVRGDDDDFEDPRRGRDQPTGLDGNWRDPRRQADRVLHTQNNVTIITLGDDSVI